MPKLNHGRAQSPAEFVNEKDKADSALLSMMPPADYDTWKNISIAYKAAGGDLGTYLDWCSRDPQKYDEKTARKLFENVDEDGEITPATLFWHAMNGGWSGGRADGRAPIAQATEPEPVDMSPTEQAIAQIESLFEPGEQVNVQTRAIPKMKDGKVKWEPADGGRCYERDDLIRRLRGGGLECILEGYTQDAGAWLCQNPTDGTGRGKERTTAWRHALIESDDIPVEDQIRIMRELDLPITTLTMSGSKSVHALVRVDADGPNHYRERVDLLHELCNEAGLKVDPANTDSSRLTRMAGVTRGDAVQELLYTRIGARDFKSWAKAHRPHPDSAEAPATGALEVTFESLFKPMPAEEQELPPVLIENTFRKGGIMLIGAAPKVGKTFLLAQMVVAFATGTRCLDFDFAKCERILVINTEMQEAEFANRLVGAAGDSVTAAMVAEHVRIANTDALPQLTVAEIADLICGSGYRPDVVLIDPIYPIFIGSEDKNEDAKTTLGYLKMIASKTGAGVIYAHHFSKGPQDLKEARDRVSGAGTLGRNYSAMWALTELAPSEEEMAKLPDGSMVARVFTDLRSFKRSKSNRNLDFIAVRSEERFFRAEEGEFDKAPTREAARRAEVNKKAAAREKRIEKVRKKIAELLNKNDGEPVPFTRVMNLTGCSANTLKDYLYDMDEYQLVKMQVGGKGQKRNHFAWTTWQAPLDAELVEVGADDE